VSKKSKKVLGRIEREKRRKKILFASIFVLISIVITAWYITSRPTPLYELTVDSDPISGVDFTVDDVSFSTSWSGDLSEGSHIVVMPSTWMVGSDSYAFDHWEDDSTSSTRTVSLAADKTVIAYYVEAIMPPPTGTLVIHTVEESTNEPLGGTTILVVGPYGYDAEVQSSEQGVYTFESIAAGAYLVAVRKTGYHTHTGSTMFPLGVDVEAGETTNITIELHGHD